MRCLKTQARQVQSTLFLLSARGYISNMVSKGSNI